MPSVRVEYTAQYRINLTPTPGCTESHMAACLTLLLKSKLEMQRIYQIEAFKHEYIIGIL